MRMMFQKVHGSENDFFLIDETILPREFTAAEIEELRLKLCNRENGLLGGADGILLVGKAKHETAVAKMRVINSDGSEASMCGNGLRTVARYLGEKLDKPCFTVETMFADLKVRKAESLGGEIATYQVEISPVSFEAETIPMTIGENTLINKMIPELSATLEFSAVAVPNPHLIAFVDHQTLMSDELEKIASYVNGENAIFNDGINVSFVEILAQNELFVRTYERGVGLTSACGTAMCASSLMYTLLKGGRFYERITVRNMGGLVKTVVHEDDDESYWMELIGNATVTHKIEGSLSDCFDKKFDDLNITETDEQEKYLDFLKGLK